MMAHRSRRGRTVARLAALVGLALLLAGCSRTEATSGVENLWRDPSFAVVEGVTTQAEVLAALGPPSQIISLQSGPAFYYLKEVFHSERMMLIVYNTAERSAAYDRAVFFFDHDGLLTKAALSKTALPLD